jgi:hypothetical protein
MFSEFSKTVFVSTLLLFQLCFFQAQADNLRLETTVKNQSGQNVHITIQMASGQAAAEKLLQDSQQPMAISENRILVSDMSAADVAASLTNSTLQATAVGEMSDIKGHSVALFNIDDNVSLNPEDFKLTQSPSAEEVERKEKRQEKIQSVIFATLQTGVAATSFLIVSNMPDTQAWVSTALAGFFSFYFNWDIERWDKFQRWGREKMKKAAGKISKKTWPQSVWFNKTTKSLTGYLGRVGFAALYSGVAMWDHFMTDFFTLQSAESIAISSFITSLIAQPYDTTLGDWQENGHHIFTKAQVELMIRMRVLVAAAVTPLIYLEYSHAYLMASGLFAGGITLMVYDQKNEIKNRYLISMAKMKAKVAPLWRNKYIDKACQLLLSRTVKP